MITEFICVLDFEYSNGIFSKTHIFKKGQKVEVLNEGNGKLKFNLGTTESKLWSKAIAIPKIMYYFESLEDRSEMKVIGIKTYNK